MISFWAGFTKQASAHALDYAKLLGPKGLPHKILDYNLLQNAPKKLSKEEIVRRWSEFAKKTKSKVN